MRSQLFRIKVLALFASGALLPGFLINCEKAAKSVQIGFFEQLGSAIAGGA